MIGSAESGLSDHLLFGGSPVMRQLQRQVDNVSNVSLPVLIEGENGTGKEMLARAIHGRSGRRDRPFLKIVCSPVAPLPDLRALIFGDAGSSDPKRELELVSRGQVGTVFFENIGNLDASGQAQVCALLEEEYMSPVSATSTQVICSSEKPLRPLVEDGLFSEDLYYQIKMISLHVPPLRERRLDIPVLAQYYLQLYAEAYERSVSPFSDQLMDAFLSADWPGNVRELRSAVKRYVLSGSTQTVIDDLKFETSGSGIPAASGELSLKELKRLAIRECEYKVILASLNRNHWNRRKTALELHISYRSLLYMMEQLGLPRKRKASAVRTTDKVELASVEPADAAVSSQPETDVTHI